MLKNYIRDITVAFNLFYSPLENLWSVCTDECGKSHIINVTEGVPPGSTLGRLLYTIVANRHAFRENEMLKVHDVHISELCFLRNGCFIFVVNFIIGTLFLEIKAV